MDASYQSIVAFGAESGVVGMAWNVSYSQIFQPYIFSYTIGFLQSLNRRWRQVGQLKGGIESGKVKGNLRSQIIFDPLTHPSDIFGIII
ncbi:hypothetical protein ES705_37826 [subsurface metagenome]